MRVAWFTPLPSGENADLASVYCTEQLLPLLRDKLDIELFTESFGTYQDYPTFHHLKAFQRHSEKPFDLAFYQLEDRKKTSFIRIHLGLMPGVVWFHDLILSDYGPEPILNSSWTETIKKFHESAHPWPARERKFKPQGPLGYREGGLAAIALFSNEHAHQEYDRQIVQKLTPKLPHYTLPFPTEIPDSTLVRSEDGLLHVGFCGEPSVESRAHKLLLALRGGSDWKLHWLIAPGERERAEELLSEYGGVDCDLIADRTPRTWEKLLEKLHVAVHTRFSAYGQPGVYLAKSLGAGKPTLVTHFASGELLSESIAFKIEAGEQEAKQIREVLKLLLEQGAQQVNLAREYASEMFDRQMIACELLRIFTDNREYLRDFQAKWEKFSRGARAEVVTEAKNAANLSWGVGATTSEELFHPGAVWARVFGPAFKEFQW